MSFRYPEISRDPWEVFEQMKVVVKAELRHPRLEVTGCSVDTGCKETMDRRTELGGEQGTYLRETGMGWARYCIGREEMSVIPKLCLGV